MGPVFMTNWERSLVAMIMFPIGRDKVLNAKMRAAFEKWVELAAARGWAEYRAPADLPGPWSEDLQLQQRFAEPHARDDQGRAGSERHPLGGTLRCVAEAPEEGLMLRANRVLRYTRWMLATAVLCASATVYAADAAPPPLPAKRSTTAGACTAIRPVEAIPVRNRCR